MRLAIVSLALVIGSSLAGCSSGIVRTPTWTKAECVHRAKLAMRDSDFTEQLSVSAGTDGHDATLRGRHGEYHAELDCASDHRTIDVRVTGPDPEETARYRDSITRRF